jgi:transcriptional regulator with XRE-family HTH domain
MRIFPQAVKVAAMPTAEDKQRAFVESVIERTGWSQTELARRAKVDPSTLSTFLSGRREGHLLSVRTISKIEQASGFHIVGGLAEPPAEAPPMPPRGFRDVDATPYKSGQDAPGAIDTAIRSMLTGRNAVDAWVLRSRALEGVGYQPGDILVVDMNGTPRPGDVVCAQIYDLTRGGAETVFRIYEPPCLVAASCDRRTTRPYILDTSHVTIKGVVTASLRDPRAIFQHQAA